ncbi:unnamed protein product [Somion occarium]|uniref:Uncharacterized protein n=1 Tax=Somion occarium TaxID=3059160 RepID=A0ABP1CSR4_9APHY
MSIPKSWEIHQGFLTGLSLLGFILVMIPLPLFIKARNIGCVLYIFWVGLLCLFTFVNDVLWRDNARNLAPVWCDIWVRFQAMGSMGMLSAGLVIARRISIIATTTSLAVDSKRREWCIDCLIGMSPPVAQLIIFYFVQGHRFDIFEGLGCYAATPISILLICLTEIWFIIIGLISAVYCARTLYAVIKRHQQIKDLFSAVSEVSLHQYYRLLAMATVEMCCTTPLSVFDLVDLSQIYYPWRGFQDLHSNFDRVGQYPYELWATDLGHIRSQWYQIGCAFIFFVLFGFSAEARNRYRHAFSFVAKVILPHKRHSRGRTKQPAVDSLVFEECHTNMSASQLYRIDRLRDTRLIYSKQKPSYPSSSKLHKYTTFFQDMKRGLDRQETREEREIMETKGKGIWQLADMHAI